MLNIVKKMTDSKFVCNARFVGRSVVDGPLNDYRLSDVVNTLQEQSRAKKSQVTHYFLVWLRNVLLFAGLESV